jgi:hypothetical protein
MIVAETVEEREKALEGILPYQREDFEAIIRLWLDIQLLFVI